MVFIALFSSKTDDQHGGNDTYLHTLNHNTSINNISQHDKQTNKQINDGHSEK